MPIAALAPVLALAVFYIVWVVYDILHSEVRHLPRWGWVLVTVLSVPIGGIVYLLIGRDPK